jgi:uncharacterized membrane protein
LFSQKFSQKSCMRCHWYRIMHGACGVNDTACIMHAVSLHSFLICIPSLFCILFSLFKVIHTFFWACGVNYMHHACDVNDTAYTMHLVSMILHAVSMIPHAPCMRYRYQWHRMHKKDFCTTSKSENHMQNKNNDTVCILKKFNMFANSNLYCIWKGFSPLIRGQGLMFSWKKKPGAKNLMTLSL